MKNNKQKLNIHNYVAFTLSEVLITLGIIGIVAAITIPTVLNNIQDSQYKAAWQNAYSIFAQAYNQVLDEYNGDISPLYVGTFSGQQEKLLSDTFAKYLITTKSCTNAQSYGECFVPLAQMKYLNGDLATAHADSGWALSWIRPSLVLNNGMIIGFSGYNEACNGAGGNCAWVTIDTNGQKGPNTLGKDLFYISTYKNKIQVGKGLTDPVGSGGQNAIDFLIK